MAGVVLAAMPAAAMGQTSWTGTGTGDWSSATDWSAGEPAGDVNADISNGATVRVTQSGELVDRLQLGAAADSTGTLEVLAGGVLTVNADEVAAQGLYLGDGGASSSGSLLIDGGTVNINVGGVTGSGAGGDLTVGRSGTGDFTLNSGTLEIGTGNTRGDFRQNANLIIGNQGTGVGTVTQTGGDATVSGTVFLGGGGVGTYTMSGGTLNVDQTNFGDIVVGNNGTGTFNVSGTADVNVNDNLRMALGGSSSGTIVQTGGSQTYQNSLFVGAGGTADVSLGG